MTEQVTERALGHPVELREPTRRPPDAVEHATERAFRRLSALRGRRVFHPDGELREATLRVTGAALGSDSAEIFAPGAEHELVVRRSRALGLPRALPDILGLAMRFPDAYGPGRDQDFLLASSLDLPVGQFLLVPTWMRAELPYSSLFPYRVGGRLRLLGALPAGDNLYRLALARPLRRFQPFAELRLGDELARPASQATRFDPWNSGGGLVPAGLLQATRRSAYRGSRDGAPGA